MNLFMQMPEKVTVEEVGSANHCRFIMQPLEPGYGVTIGNALRRILLSSIPGSAIIGVKITDVLHEYQTVTGVLEDVMEIILNLKEVRFKMEETHSNRVVFHIKGPGTWTAKNIQNAAPELMVLNPDHHIATLDKDANFDVELRLGTGKGYIPWEDQQITDFPVGMLPIDAIYTPIVNVIYTIEPYRVGQRTDYERLILETRTDGTITSEDAVQRAASIMNDHIRFFITAEEIAQDEEFPVDTELEEQRAEIEKVREILDTPVEDLELSVRVHNCLKAANISVIADLVRFQESELLKFRNFGRKSLTELIQKIKDMGVDFGMNVEFYYKFDKKNK